MAAGQDGGTHKSKSTQPRCTSRRYTLYLYLPICLTSREYYVRVDLYFSSILSQIINHMEDRHANELRGRNNMDLIRSGLISAPIRLSSYKCKKCNMLFIGQTKEDVYR